MIGRISVEYGATGSTALRGDYTIDGEDLEMANDEIAMLLGNGKSKVSVSLSMRDGEYGKGFSALVTVELHCNQDSESLEVAHFKADELAQKYLDASYKNAKKMFTRT